MNCSECGNGPLLADEQVTGICIRCERAKLGPADPTLAEGGGTMSKAPDRCGYCAGDDPNCGFCEMGVPLDTQEDWDTTWGKVLKGLGRLSQQEPEQQALGRGGSE